MLFFQSTIIYCFEFSEVSDHVIIIHPFNRTLRFGFKVMNKTIDCFTNCGYGVVICEVVEALAKYQKYVIKKY